MSIETTTTARYEGSAVARLVVEVEIDVDLEVTLDTADEFEIEDALTDQALGQAETILGSVEFPGVLHSFEVEEVDLG